MSQENCNDCRYEREELEFWKKQCREERMLLNGVRMQRDAEFASKMEARDTAKVLQSLECSQCDADTCDGCPKYRLPWEVEK